ncbi:uncharacterized protein ACBR49_018748 [Aulostomus maculatus]
MSAPAPVPAAMPTMVSRLPKFGSRPKSAAPFTDSQTDPSATSNTSTFTGAAATSTRLTNGFYHHPGPAGVNCGVADPATSVKPNGFIRVPTSFSLKWRKENVAAEDGDAEKEWRRGKAVNVGQNCNGNTVHQNYPLKEKKSPQSSPVVSQAKKPAASSTGKGRGFCSPATSKSSSPTPQSSPRTLPVSKNGFYGFKSSNAASGLTNGTKQTPNGLSGSKPQNGAVSSLRQPQSYVRPGGSRPGSGPGSRAGSPLLKKAPASRSHSSDSLGSGPAIHLSESDRLRSRSLTQVQRQSPPTLTPSFPRSLNRAPPERGLKEPISSSTKPPVRGCSASQTPEGGGRGGKSGLSIPSLMPPSALKKPLLPGLGLASKPSGISYKLSRPSITKQSRPLRVTSKVSAGDPDVNQAATGRRNSVETPSTTENSPESSPEAPESEGLLAEKVSQGELSIVGETLEDMSLSSTSSLDRNDTSQEYMDDFDNLGNGGVGVLLLSTKDHEDDSGLDQSCAGCDDAKVAIDGITKATGLCFLDDGMDWTGMRLSGERGEQQLTRLSRQRRSSQPDYHDQGGSSLDLSPSDSCGSGGTYMWDEEGLEPLGGAATAPSISTNGNTTHCIGSFDSDLNSNDILNNLDCDLDDDDLILDADFSEDASLHSDGDGLSHMAQWRRRQLCWGTQDIHNDNETDFRCYKLSEDPGNKRRVTAGDGDLILELCSPRSPCLSPGLGLDVEELAEDCSAVKSQLEYLQRLLLQEEDADDDTLTTDTLNPEASESSQMQALLLEVQQLRAELRSRDQTIAQLSQQLTATTVTTRCRCQETRGRMDRYTQTTVAEKESVASQTPWRPQTSQILHSSTQEDQKPLTAPPSAKPCSTLPTHRVSDHPETNATHCSPEEGEADGKQARKEEEKEETTKKRGTHNRSLRLPQPSKLHLFLSQTSSSAATIAAASRLPKPKSH